MLRDQNQNEIEVAIENKNGKCILLMDGHFWRPFMAYWLVVGSQWYLPINIFSFLKLETSLEMNWSILALILPLKMMLRTQSANDYRKSFVRYGSNALFLPTVFCHTIVKQLTSEDVTSGALVSCTFYFFTIAF